MNNEDQNYNYSKTWNYIWQGKKRSEQKLKQNLQWENIYIYIYIYIYKACQIIQEKLLKLHSTVSHIKEMVDNYKTETYQYGMIKAGKKMKDPGNKMVPAHNINIPTNGSRI